MSIHWVLTSRQAIVDVHFPAVKQDLVKEALEIFFDVRKVPGMKKKPSTSELIDWLKLLMADDIPDEILTNRDTTKAIPPLYGALVKNEQDVHLLERLAFMVFPWRKVSYPFIPLGECGADFDPGRPASLRTN